ncbi:MAG: DMT family transporter [Hyphomicrobiaceae bacterium]
MDTAVVMLALGAAIGLGLSLVLAQIGLRHLTPLRGACISVPSTALTYLALSPVLLDLTGFTAGSAMLFALAGCLFPAAVTVLTFEGNRRVGPAITGALGNLSPLFAVLIALALLGEVPRAGQLAGMAVILLGVLLIVGAPRSVPGGGFGWAIGMVLLAAFIRGGAQPVVKLGLEAWPSPFAATLIGYVVSASMILGAGVVREGAGMLPFRTRGWAWFIPVGWLNGAALLAIYAALARGPVAVVAPLVACYPLAALVFGRILLGSGGLTPVAGLGVAVTVAGVALLLRA